MFDEHHIRLRHHSKCKVCQQDRQYIEDCNIVRNIQNSFFIMHILPEREVSYKPYSYTRKDKASYYSVYTQSCNDKRRAEKEFHRGAQSHAYVHPFKILNPLQYRNIYERRAEEQKNSPS